jgi:hypothetical protein
MLALGGSNLAYSQVYKWVDEKGVTQYSASPPPAGKGKKIINKPAHASGATAKPTSAEMTWQEKEVEFRARRAAAAERQHREEAMRGVAQHKAGEQRANCMAAHRDLVAPQKQQRIFSLDERGERKYVDDKDRPRMTEDLKKIVVRDCAK